MAKVAYIVTGGPACRDRVRKLIDKSNNVG